MTDTLHDQLKRWGMATVNRYAANEDGPSAGDSVLGRTFKVANGKKLDRELLKRDGSSRRAIMAARAGVETGLSVVPKWACDPIRSKNDADYPHDRPVARVDLGIPDDLRWIDRALAQMARQHAVRALCIREEFTGQGTQRMKAMRVQRALGGKFTVWMYRKEIERGLEWMRGSKAA
jgi:hypothetical protein